MAGSNAAGIVLKLNHGKTDIRAARRPGFSLRIGAIRIWCREPEILRIKEGYQKLSSASFYGSLSNC